MTRFVFFVLLISATSSYSQSSLEQKAVEYFFTKHFEVDYPEVKAIQFRGKTDVSLTEFSFFENCFKDSTIAQQLYQNARGKSLPEKSIEVKNIPGMQFSYKPVKGKYRLHILQANKANDKQYVMVEVTKHKHHTSVYFFEFDSSGNILRDCKAKEMH